MVKIKVSGKGKSDVTEMKFTDENAAAQKPAETSNQQKAASLNCGINGTLSISEGKDSDSTYAFFRNEKLQRVIDDFNINRIIFPREGGTTFEKEVHFDTTKHSVNECNKNLPPFHTDGSYETIKSTDRNVRKWRVSGATYIFEYITRTLTIPQNYDIDKIAEILNSFTV